MLQGSRKRLRDEDACPNREDCQKQGEAPRPTYAFNEYTQQFVHCGTACKNHKPDGYRLCGRCKHNHTIDLFPQEIRGNVAQHMSKCMYCLRNEAVKAKPNAREAANRLYATVVAAGRAPEWVDEDGRPLGGCPAVPSGAEKRESRGTRTTLEMIFTDYEAAGAEQDPNPAPEADLLSPAHAVAVLPARPIGVAPAMQDLFSYMMAQSEQNVRTPQGYLGMCNKMFEWMCENKPDGVDIQERLSDWQGMLADAFLAEGDTTVFKALGAPFPMHGIMADLHDGRLRPRPQLAVAFCESRMIGLVRLAAERHRRKCPYSLDVYVFLSPGAERIDKLVLLYRELGQAAHGESPSKPQAETIEASDLSKVACAWQDSPSPDAETERRWRNQSDMMAIKLRDLYQLMHIPAVRAARRLGGMGPRAVVNLAQSRCTSAGAVLELLTEAYFSELFSLEAPHLAVCGGQAGMRTLVDITWDDDTAHDLGLCSSLRQRGVEPQHVSGLDLDAVQAACIYPKGAARFSSHDDSIYCFQLSGPVCIALSSAMNPQSRLALPSGESIEDLLVSSIGSVVFGHRSVVLLDFWLQCSERSEVQDDEANLLMDQLVSSIEAEHQAFVLASLLTTAPASNAAPPLLAWVADELSGKEVGLFRFWNDAKRWAKKAAHYTHIPQRKPEGNPNIAPAC